MNPTAKPYRNQRVSRPKQRRQQHLLEVSIRRDKERERRMRRGLALFLKVMILSALLAGVWVGAREGLRRFFWENPAFYLTDVRIETDGTLTRDQILQATGAAEGRNILLTDMDHAYVALDRLPQVERVVIQRVLPNRIDITVTERRPIAWVAAQGEADPTSSERSFLIDARGYVMKSRKLLPEYYHLPIISGFETGNLVGGRKVTDFEIQAALELLKLNAESTRWQIRNIDLSKGYCLTVTSRNRAQVMFGFDNMDKQLARFYRLLDSVNPGQGELQTVNLLVERNTPVTFHTPAIDPVPVAEPVEPVPRAEAVKATAVKATAANEPARAASARKTGASATKTGRSGASSPRKKSGAEPLRKPFRL